MTTQVYECEYQEYAIQYISECSSGLRTTDIPFFPPPDNAPGSCSCNLGQLYLAINGSENEGASCLSNVTNSALADLDNDPVKTANKEEACACCGESGAISAYVIITQPPPHQSFSEAITANANHSQFLQHLPQHCAFTDWH